MNLTEDEICVVLCMLTDIDNLWGMQPKERELYEKLNKERETFENKMQSH